MVIAEGETEQTFVRDQLAGHLAFTKIVEQAGHPEAINDGRETCPSRKIAQVVSAYRKRLHGPIVTRRIGLETLRERCDHFAAWLGRLEAIGS